MEYFYLIKATQKSGKADAIIWRSAKSEARAQLQLDVDLEDAEIETGRGKDYLKPIRTDFPVFNDLPAEGVLDFEWCKRYQLGDDQRTWQVIPGAVADSTTVVEDEIVNGDSDDIHYHVSPQGIRLKRGTEFAICFHAAETERRAKTLLLAQQHRQQMGSCSKTRWHSPQESVPYAAYFCLLAPDGWRKPVFYSQSDGA